MNISSASAGGSAAELSANYQSQQPPSVSAQAPPAATPASGATDSDGDHDGDHGGGLLNVKA